MLRQAWRPLVTTAIFGSAGYYFFFREKRTFELAVKTKDANGNAAMTTRVVPLLSKAQVDSRLAENAIYQSILRPGGIVWNYTTASVASNDPIEDANASQILARNDADPAAAVPGDLLFFSVMDGHSGPHTSRLLSRILIRAVASELELLAKDPERILPDRALLGKIKSLIRPSDSIAAHTDPKSVSFAIQNAFSKLDHELINAPLRVLAASLDRTMDKSTPVPDLSQHPLGLASMQPAVSGSCALMAVLDTAHRDLYVSCTGDSRAVAGVWEETPDGQGCWRVEVLSEDQTGRNPEEVQRIQSEHPAEESPFVIQRGRVLGSLEPTRAFGDARYKWPPQVQNVLNQAFMLGNGTPLRPPPPGLKTPPYVTATPVVTHRKLEFPPFTSDTSDRSPKSSMRFLVLATDGLWDELSSEEVVSLVGGYLAGLKGTIPKSTLPSLVPISSGAPTVEGKQLKRVGGGEGSWAFVDENLSTHLIRNAFGGGDEGKLRRILSIPAPYSRRYRDDVTVTVIWWEDGREGEIVKSTSPGTSVRAKL